MKYRTLGSTSIEVSEIAFGAGPVPELMTTRDTDRQINTVKKAIELGINWFDTAATYGNGSSEEGLGRAFNECGISSEIHVATKVRLMPDDLDDICGSIRHSTEASLKRLQQKCVTLLQLHNSITRSLGDLHTSLTPGHVLNKGGVLETFQTIKEEGLARHIGITGLGHPESIREVIHAGEFETVQTPFNLLDPSAGQLMSSDFEEEDLGNIVADCVSEGMGVFAIRVFAGGALALLPPSSHTFKTKFFPLDLYKRDVARATRLKESLGSIEALKRKAVKFVLDSHGIRAAIIGFSNPEQVEEVVGML